MTDGEFKTSLIDQLKFLQYTLWLFVCVFCFWSGCLHVTISDKNMAGSAAHTVGVHGAGYAHDSPLRVEIVKPVPVADVEEKAAATEAEEAKAGAP